MEGFKNNRGKKGCGKKKSVKRGSMRRRNVEIEEVKEKVYTDNEWYGAMTLNGEQLMKELPHYGQYNDGRIYSTWHSLSKEVRKEVKLCR